MLKNGQKFAHFTIIRKIGEGGMGVVYLAEDLKLSRKVALKILLSEFFEKTERLERFKREAKIAAQINHTNVMSIFDIGTDKDSDTGKELHYIVMEYIEGESLSSHIKNFINDLSGAVRLAEKIASGLAAAHKLGIVHRDIKTDNIIVKADGEPKILDFGLAKPTVSALGEDDSEDSATISKELTRAGKILGTVSYMSPEQAQGKAVDARSDIFSFGIMLYRMVTGNLPFEGTTQVSTLAKILESNHEPPHLKNENIPPELERIIDKCLQKDVNDRYQDTRDLVVDLRGLRRQYDSGITDTISGITGIITKQKPSNAKATWIKLTGMVIGLLIILVVIFGLYNKMDTNQVPFQSGVQAGENCLAIIGFENKTGDTTLNWLETGLPEIMLTDLAQGQAIKLISRERILDCFDDELKKNHSYEQCVKVARSLGAANVLSGAYYKLGEKIRIDARMEDATNGSIVFAEKVIGDDLFTMVDSLTGKIVASLNIKEIMASKQNVKQYMTSSPEAFKHYMDGMQDFLNELYDDSIEKMNRALAIDSNFALAYMRIALANIFQGKLKNGVAYLVKAKGYEKNLPLREKSLLDIYSDLWLEPDYNKGFTKMEAFVKNYPDDKEGRAFNALLLNSFSNDTTLSMAQLDTALMLDPKYQIALRFYADFYADLGILDKAVEYTQKYIEYHPDSPSGYENLAGYLQLKGKFDDAIVQYRLMINKFPPKIIPYLSLSRLFIRKRMFDSALFYIERFHDINKDDNYFMIAYYNNLANLDVWKGKFKGAIKNGHEACKQALLTGDSAQIWNTYRVLSVMYQRLGTSDSALYYNGISYQWATSFQRVNYSQRMVTIDKNKAEEARDIFEKEITEFKAHLPPEMWGLADAASELFDATCKADTTALIESYNKLIENSMNKSNEMSNQRELSIIYINAGQYEEAKKILEKLYADDGGTTNAYLYLIKHYYLARACEGLGENETAVEAYSEVLKYWGNPDIELKEIKDTRTRLARLTS